MGLHGGADGGLEGAREELGGLSEGGSGKALFARHRRDEVRSEVEEMRFDQGTGGGDGDASNIMLGKRQMGFRLKEIHILKPST